MWFKLDASSNGMGDGDEDMSEEQRTGWRRLRSRAGVHQGRPLSCFLAALGLVKCLLAAQRAMDNFHAMERYPEGVSDADKAKARELAEKMGAVTSYLDDATCRLCPRCVSLIEHTVRWRRVEDGSAWRRSQYWLMVLGEGSLTSTTAAWRRRTRGSRGGIRDCNHERTS